jgi:hypothetical protein
MQSLIQFKRTTLLFRISLALALFGFSSRVGAVSPAPDGCYPAFTTAEGCNALKNLTAGSANTGLGWFSLVDVTTGNFNTGVGAGTLVLNTADSNTAVGAAALFLNTTGTENVAVGTGALVHNDTAEQNTATGAFALFSHISGNGNTAIGTNALLNDATGESNTAIGDGALFNNIGGPFPGSFNTATGASALFANTGPDNTANGALALQSNTMGGDNTAVGIDALTSNTIGNHNVALGSMAGFQQTTGSDNIYIGFDMQGTAGESNACYIGSIDGQTSASGIAVLINSNGKLGTTTSSRRFKEGIKPMDNASEALFALKPVTFRYKKELDPQGIQQWGLVAEDVQKINPALVALDKEGTPYAVRYDQVNAMLLNEFLKEHRQVQEQKTTITELKSGMAQQQKQIEALTAGLQRVSAQLELSKFAPQTVLNDH